MTVGLEQRSLNLEKLGSLKNLTEVMIMDFLQFLLMKKEKTHFFGHLHHFLVNPI